MDNRPNRILIVDSDPVARRLLAQYIVGKGWDVVSAVDGAEALRSFDVGVYRVVLTGVDRAAWADGVGLIRTMLRRDPRVRVAIMTGGTPDAEMAREAGFGPLLIKPLRAVEVDDLLGGKSFRVAAR
jgi:DNA-binding NtrC family response regulator